MTFGYLNNLNSYTGMHNEPNFCARRSSSAQNNEDTPIDKIVKRVDEEKKKKHNKTAIAVGGSVLGLSLLVGIMNPRISSKLVKNLRNLQNRVSSKLESSRGDTTKNTFYTFVANAIDWCTRFLGSINNVNSVKDTYYKQLCTEDKLFSGVRNMGRRKRLEKCDNIFRKIMQKPHELITQWGDTLAKNTVKRNYRAADKQMNNLERLISEYADKLPADKRAEVSAKLAEIKSQRECFSVQSLDSRFAIQEDLMSNLNNDIRARWTAYKQGFKNKFVRNYEHFDRNLSFWAQDLMQPEKDKITAEGMARVDNLFGNNEGVKGQYRAIMENFDGVLNTEEKNLLEKTAQKTEKSLRAANDKECNNYFDKKRDLILGSAPTDILSSVILLSLGGVAFAASDDRDKRISRLITKIIPAFAGVITNITLTTMLFSGTKNLLYAAGTGFVLSRIGSKIDKARLAAKNKVAEEE